MKRTKPQINSDTKKKKIDPQMNSDTKKKKIETNSSVSVEPIFANLTCHVLPAHFGMGRLKIFKTQIEKYGGKLVDSLIDSKDDAVISHIIVEETVDFKKVLKLLGKEFLSNKVIVRCPWISNCIKSKCIQDTADQILKDLLNGDMTKDAHSDTIVNDSCEVDCTPSTSVQKLAIALPPCSDGIAVPSNLEDDSSPCGNTDGYHLPLPIGKLQSKFACAHSSKSRDTSQSVNSHITAELRKLLEVYKSKNDTWRIAGYQKAIAAIEAYPQEITTYEVARSIRGVGEKLAAKVAEIASSGRLRKVDEVCGSEETATITLFMGVWGAGPTTAQNWYTQGFRSLSDLREKASLTRHQKVGLLHYDDLNSRIPRSEATEIHSYVKRSCDEVRSGLVAEVCGSYRRGRETCGDVDVLVTHPDGISHEGVFRLLLANMRSKGFLTDDLVTQEDNGNQQKYLGVCRLPGPDRKHRRLDIIVVPYSEFAPAIMYFTGSAHFNRSMRLLATKLGMSLSEHGLRVNVVRQGREKLTPGCLLETPSEESIFQHLGLPYRAPCDRDH